MFIFRWFARGLFGLLGWQLIGDLLPHVPKAVLVLAPHTSNWDGFYGLLFALAKKLPLRFVIKREAMVFPLGLLLRSMGAVPIDRKHQRGRGEEGMVTAMADLFKDRSSLLLSIAPEGTRGKVKRWRHGFYRVAEQAGVPIRLFFIDYGKKHIGFGPVFYPTGNIEEDLKEIQAFYKDKQGKYPDQG